MAKSNDVAIASLRSFLPALCRLSLSMNVSAKLLDEMIREAYVQVVTEDFGIGGRPTNVSRTMIYTDLSRAEVNKIRKKLATLVTERASEHRRHGLGSLLREWFANENYLDESGKPIELPITGKEISLETLSRMFFSDVPVTAVLKELVEAQAVKHENKRVTVLRPFLHPLPKDPEYMSQMGKVIDDFLSTVYHNLIRDDESSRVEMRSINKNVAREHEDTFRKFLEKEAEGFCKRVDRWLTDKHEYETKENDECPTIGFGLYQISE